MTQAPAAAPRLHPQAQAILDRIIGGGEPPIETLTVAQARAVADPRVIRTAGKGPEVGSVADREIAGPAGPVALRVYHPERREGSGPLPVLFYMHGGGFVLGNLDTADAICRTLTARAGCIVVSAHYRLAPEHKFPAAFEDCYAAAVWTAANAAALGGDPDRIAIGGESAGGLLTAAVTQAARDSGTARFVLQFMVYPSTDMGAHFPSFERLGNGFFLTTKKMQWFHDHYIRGPEDADDPRASPLRAKSFAGLPPALIITAGLDPLVDQGAAYAEKLTAAGVPTDYQSYEGWPHGFMYWGNTEGYERAVEQITAALRKAFGPKAGAAAHR